MFFNRTFHPDEANQAFTTGRLLETGHYTYRPSDHHGPTLYYAAAPLQKAAGHASFAELDGVLLRCTPLIFAILGLLFLAHTVYRLVRISSNTFSRTFAGLAALGSVLLLGSAPIFAFFATDFIQEMLLVSFTLMMLWAGVGYYHSRMIPGRIKPGTWALLFGVGAGLSFATKETCILTFTAALLAGIPFFVFRPRSAPVETSRATGLMSHGILALQGFLLTAVLLFSSFCQNWQGVYDAFVSAPLHYLGRAAGDAAASEGANWHVHPWWQHLKWLLGFPISQTTTSFRGGLYGPFSNFSALLHLLVFQLPIGSGLAILARRSGKRNSPLLLGFLYLSLFTLLLTVLYSAIPYKTPWCTLQIIVPLLAAVALGFPICALAITTFFTSRGHTDKVVRPLATLTFLVLMPLSLIGCHHVRGLAKINQNPDSAEIPYTYAHASPESIQLATCVADAVQQHQGLNGEQPPSIVVALPPEDTWPFPWYNRRLSTYTGYWTSFEDLEVLANLGMKPTVVIVPMTQGHLVMPLFPHLRHTKRFYMRPGVRVRVFW